MARCVMDTVLTDRATQGGMRKAMFPNTYNDLTDLTDLFNSSSEARLFETHGRRTDLGAGRSPKRSFGSFRSVSLCAARRISYPPQFQGRSGRYERGPIRNAAITKKTGSRCCSTGASPRGINRNHQQAQRKHA